MTDRLGAVLAGAVPRVCAAAVALVAVDGSVAAAAATGELVRYADAEGTLAAERPPAGHDSIFDLASISKLFTTAVLLSLAEEGTIGLDEPVAAWIPGHDPRVTPRRLLTHTAGLPPTRRIDLELPDADASERMEAMLRTPIAHPVGGPYLYSDVGLVIAGRVAELAGGAPLDALVRARVTDVLGLADTGYRPVAPPRAATLSRVAATEWKPERPGPGCVRGEVHDETAYALGGVAGHAGLFATAGDLLAFGEALRLGATRQDGGVLRPESVAEMLRDQGAEGAAFRHGLGVRIGDPAIAGPLSGAFGHSGFTGTSLVVDPARGLTVVLLTNAVHPVRGRDGIRELRHAVAGEALRLRELQPLT
ncbi:serine hydrolase domain-containing protein [Nonomuraea jabiensis]|uniref:CubicO group peptidase (Beta-lactamase class C family) n=1 Tax=Nonomuraea jabiensis TaxID=882448 RepID=A0A7W9GA73_9ACTN|nr:serine hydrolase domain-containing protein [Nonomuraea jabiensis]MBB5780024.1 CubicO group peptidase (beta-lactamase class C family) [Nonomuraea jabiensis]